MHTITSLAGFDDTIVQRLDEDARFRLSVVSACGVLSVLLATCGLGYGAHLALGGLVVPLLIALTAGLVVTNLVRLHHAGSGFPAHRPLDEIERHRPALVGVVVFFALGCMMTSPCAMWTLAPVLKRDVAASANGRASLPDVPDRLRGADTPGAADHTRATDGLIARGHAFVARPVAAGALTSFFALLFSAVAWLKFFFLRAVRAYERERYVLERALVDAHFGASEEHVVSSLTPWESFDGTLRRHFVDPPYNTMPAFFGVMPDALFKDARFVRPWDADDDVPASVPAEALPEPPAEANETAAPVVEKAEPPVEQVPPVDEGALGGEVEEPEAKSVWDEPLVDDGNPPAVYYLDIGRLPAERARRHSDEVTPFIAAVTGRSPREVAALLRVAPDDIPVHKLFSEYKSLRAILMREAGFAREHGFTRLVSIIVGLPEDDVTRRIEAAAPEARLTGVFAPELAKRILRKERR